MTFPHRNLFKNDPADTPLAVQEHYITADPALASFIETQQCGYIGA